MSSPVRQRVEVRGIVQGVGFRPAVYRTAVGLGLTGFVGNDAHGVFIEVEGDPDAVGRFVDGLPAVVPPLAVVDTLTTREVPARGETGFRIADSIPSATASTLVSPDIAPCDPCRTELADPADRRYRYPFINCTDCGPRYSILRGVPYDRPRTTMAGFTMCVACAREYSDPADRRYHAQPICCPTCGPRLVLRDAAFVPVLGDGPDETAADVVAAVADRLAAGEVVALKGVGGYNLAVDATDEGAVSRLRARKHRAEKPFAVLVGDIEAARGIAAVGLLEADLLASPERPIVVLPRNPDGPIAASVAPGNPSVGVMLPPSPLHVLVVEAFGRPLVMTSGNRSDEPIVFDDVEVAERLAGIADAYCTHDRPIHVRVDDSVTRVVGSRQVVVRRARGHVPRPVLVAGGFPRHTLACGALLKATVCVGRDDRAFLSEHLGDLDDHATYASYEQAIEHLCELFDVRPEVAAHDLHPDFPSSAYATERAGVETVAVQHHHAHIASCLIDNGVAGPVIGLAFDGLGLGADGSIWGGEVLAADLLGFDRLGHLATVPMPGGDAAVREPWRMAAAHLAGVLDVDATAALDVFRRNRARWPAIVSMVRSGVHAPATSSMGRLFDAVAALVGVRDEVTYEGQAAIELEQLVVPDEWGSYAVALGDGEPFTIDTTGIIAGVAADVRAGTPPGVVAARFHNAVVDLIVAAAQRARAGTTLTTVALSGGVFLNAVLVERATARLAAAGFEVLTHRRVPPNDGGISLGQAAIVAARDRA